MYVSAICKYQIKYKLYDFYWPAVAAAAAAAAVWKATGAKTPTISYTQNCKHKSLD